MKDHNFEEILTFGGLLCPALFTDEGQILCAKADQWSTPMHQISSGSVFFCHPLAVKKTKFGIFFQLRHFVVSPVGSYLRKLNADAQQQTFCYTTVSKSFVYSNVFMAKLCAKSLMLKTETNKLTKAQHFWTHFGRPSG